jgi:hypothetical protein
VRPALEPRDHDPAIIGHRPAAVKLWRKAHVPDLLLFGVRRGGLGSFGMWTPLLVQRSNLVFRHT